MGEMTPDEMKRRTKALCVSVYKVVDDLPRSASGRNLADQLCRSGSSVGANYRAARRARSRKEFLSKLGNVEEEADEVLYWLEIGVEAKLLDAKAMRPLWKEANEILAIVVATIRSTRGKN